MLSDSPSNYRREPESLAFLAAVPTTWDETVGVDGRIGESVVVARRKGDEWWVGAMTDWTARTIEVPLSFARSGAWDATLWTDGANADKVGTDYRRTSRVLEPGATLRLALASGGGAVVRLRHR
jgi:alpha-glucosidase